MKYVFIILATIPLLFSLDNYLNLKETKRNACPTFESIGFHCIGYEGYNWGSGIGPWGGAHVWYTLYRTEDPKTIYEGFVARWGDEYHVYNMQALNAVSTR